jgi:transcription initiation factor TFIID subunit 7
LENVNPDLSDSEFLDMEQEQIDLPEGGLPGSDVIDAPTPSGTAAEGEADGEEDEGELDEELAAELDLALGDGDADEEGDDGDGDDEEEESDEDEDEDVDEDDEAGQAKRLLNEEIRDLEAAVAKKNMEISSSANPLIRVRFPVFFSFYR